MWSVESLVRLVLIMSLVLSLPTIASAQSDDGEGEEDQPIEVHQEIVVTAEIAGTELVKLDEEELTSGRNTNVGEALLDIPGVDGDKLEADVRSFVENVMGFTLVTRRELTDLEDRLEKAEKALAKQKTTAAKKAAPRKTAKKPAAKAKTPAQATPSAAVSS